MSINLDGNHSPRAPTATSRDRTRPKKVSEITTRHHMRARCHHPSVHARTHRSGQGDVRTWCGGWTGAACGEFSSYARPPTRPPRAAVRVTLNLGNFCSGFRHRISCPFPWLIGLLFWVAIALLAVYIYSSGTTRGRNVTSWHGVRRRGRERERERFPWPLRETREEEEEIVDHLVPPYVPEQTRWDPSDRERRRNGTDDLRQCQAPGKSRKCAATAWFSARGVRGFCWFSPRFRAGLAAAAAAALRRRTWREGRGGAWRPRAPYIPPGGGGGRTVGSTEEIRCHETDLSRKGFSSPLGTSRRRHGR